MEVFKLLLTYSSPIFGLIGSILIFFFGIPKKIDTGGRGYICLEGEDINEKHKIRIYKIWGNIGILLIILSFLIEIVGKFIMNSGH